MPIFGFITDKEKQEWLKERAGKVIDRAIADITRPVQQAAEQVTARPPQIELPRIDLPQIPTPRIELPQVPVSPGQAISNVGGYIGDFSHAFGEDLLTGLTEPFNPNQQSGVDVARQELEQRKREERGRAPNPLEFAGDILESTFSPERVSRASDVATERYNQRSPFVSIPSQFLLDPINTISAPVRGATAGGRAAALGVDAVIGGLTGANAGRELTGESDLGTAAGFGLGAAASFLPDIGMGVVGNITGRNRPNYMGPAPTKQAQQQATQQAAQSILGANEFVKPLRDFDEVLNEVRTAGNPITRTLARATGINPSAAETRTSGRIGIAGIRQRNAGQQSADLAVQQALDPFEPQLLSDQGLSAAWLTPAAGPGGTIFDIQGGQIRNIQPRQAGASLNWHDVFSNPGAYNLNADQQAYIRKYAQLPVELEAARVAAGLPERAADLSPETFYIPRRAVRTGGVPLDAPANPSLMRQYEMAQEGVDAGVEYLDDPRETMLLHLRAGMQEIADHQMNQTLRRELGRVNPATGQVGMVSPKNLVRGDLVQERRDAVLNLRRAQQGVRRERDMVIASQRQVARDITEATERLTDAERTLARIRGELSGRAQTTTGQRQTPTSYGPRLQAAQEAVDEARSELRQLEKLARDIPRYTRSVGDVGTSARSAQELASARSRYNRARASYSQGLKTARATRVADASIFGMQQGGKIPIKLWKNNFIPAEDYEAIARTVGVPGEPQVRAGGVTRGIEKAANTIRYFSATGDFAMPFNQGLTLLGRNPVAWSRMALRTYASFIDPTIQARYLARQDNVAAAQDMVRYGVEIGNTNDILSVGQNRLNLPRNLRESQAVRNFAESGVGQFTTRAARRGRQQVLGRFESSYATGLTMARMELWKSLAPHFKDKAELASYINKMTGGLNSQNLGVSANQRAVESMWMAFSPRLLRSTAALMATAAGSNGMNSQSAWEARRTLVGMATAASLLYVTTGKVLQAQGAPIDDQDILDGLNPLNGKEFLSYKIGDDWYGVGGQVRSMIQLGTKLGAIGVRAGELESQGKHGEAAAELAKLVSRDSNENPIVQFATTRGAPGVTLATNALEASTGVNANPYREVEGLGGFARETALSAIPFGAQNATEGQSGTAVGASIFGARTSPATPTDRLNTAAQERFDNPDEGRRVRSYYEDLQRSEQDVIRRENPELIQQAIEKSTPQRQQYERERQFYEQRQAEFDRELAQTKDLGTWRKRFADNRDNLRAVRESIYGRDAENTEKDPTLKAYYDIVRANEKNGEVNWDAVDAEVMRQELDQEHIDRETGLGWTDTVRKYRDAQRAVKPEMDTFMDMSSYRGLTKDQSEVTNDLIAAARSYQVINRVSYRAAVNALAKERGLSGRVVSVAKRPETYRNRARTRYWKRHPELEAVYGDLAPQEMVETALAE